MTGYLDDTAFGRKIPLENHETTGSLDRFLNGQNDILTRSLPGLCSLNAKRRAAYGLLASIDQRCVDEPFGTS
jgi:hypothetical protein